MTTDHPRPPHTHSPGSTYFHVDRNGTVPPGAQITPFDPPLSRHGHQYSRQPAPNAAGEANGQPQNFVTANYAIETFWELYRQIHHPTLPSRFHSLFAFETIEAAQHFLNSTGGQAILRVSPEQGAVHRGDMAWLRAGNFEEMSNRAHHYWTGVPSGNPDWEIVLPLPATIHPL